jgi:hypothetical protein
MADATSGVIDSDVSPGIEPDGIDVRGASVVVVVTTDDVVVSAVTVDDSDPSDESQAAATRENAMMIATRET